MLPLILHDTYQVVFFCCRSPTFPKWLEHLKILILRGKSICFHCFLYWSQTLYFIWWRTDEGNTLFKRTRRQRAWSKLSAEKATRIPYLYSPSEGKTWCLKLKRCWQNLTIPIELIQCYYFWSTATVQNKRT